MKNRGCMLLVSALCFGLGSGLARASEELARENGCLSCHSVNKKVIGPAYRDVAAKYRAKPNAAAMLEKKVRTGGKGVWGEIPMPPQTTVSDADLKSIITWVLAR